jgi:HSP20 family protein
MMRGSNFGDDMFDFERMFRRMNRQFEEMNRQFARAADARPALESGDDRPVPAWMGRSGISVDVAERDGDVVVTADLPGFETDDIDLSVAGTTLTIRADHDADDEYESGDYVRRERHHRSVSRAVSLPSEVDEQAAGASYTNGVLTVTLPARDADEGDQGHRIQVE